MSSDLEHRIVDRLDEMDNHLAALLSFRGELGRPTDRRQLLLALDRRLAAMAAAIDDER
jgi:hypothetical protein